MISLNGEIKLANNTTIHLTNRNLTEVNIGFNSVSAIDLPSYGVISNSGSLSFIDYDKTVLNNLELLKSNILIEINLKNSTKNIVEEKGKWYTDKWDYDANNNLVSVTIKDDLLEWQKISISKYALLDKMTMFEIYELLKSLTPSKFVFEIDTTTENFLKNANCEYSYLENGSLWSQFDKLCQVCALNIFKTPKNTVKVIHRI